MTPEEIAREIARKHALMEGRCLCESGRERSGLSQCTLEEDIAAALAASEQRVIDGFISQTYAADLKKERDDLRAQLQASERRVKGLENEKETLRLWLVSAEAKLQASERALERVKWTLAEIRGLVPAIAPAGDHGMQHLRQIAKLIEDALASPGSPQEKGK